jgi:group I intron endonuclease
MYTVYFHRNKINGKVYVGSTSLDPNTRWRKNGEGYNKHSNFYPEIKEYGWNNFEHIIVARNLTKEEALRLEGETIAKYNSADPNHGYNMTHSGQGRLAPNDKFRESISGENNPMYGEDRSGKNNPMFGRNHSNDTRLKLSEIKIGSQLPGDVRQKISKANSGTNNPMWGKNQTPISRRKMSAVKLSKKCPGFKGILNINTGLIFSTVSEAARYFNIPHQNISKCCLGKYHSAGKHPDTGEPMLWVYHQGDMVC